MKMVNEKEKAVAAAHQQEQRIAQDKLQETKHMYEMKLQDLREVIAGKNQDILRLEQDLEATIRHKKEIAKELISTRDEFQTFIDKTSPFEKGKSDFLLPPPKSLQKTLEREQLCITNFSFHNEIQFKGTQTLTYGQRNTVSSVTKELN